MVSSSTIASSSRLSAIVRSDKTVILVAGYGGVEDFGLSSEEWYKADESGVGV